MIDRKNRRAGGDSSDAKEAERAWRASSPEAAALPSAEIRPTRAERRAMRELQLQSDNEHAQRQAAKAMRRERDSAKEAERLRNRRKRPYKHLPTGLATLYVLVELEAGKRPSIRLCQEDTPGAQALISEPASYRTLEPVTPDLASEAAALRAVLDFERNPITSPPVVLREIAAAIRVAATAVREAWIPTALTLVHTAVVYLQVKAHGALDSYKLSGTPPPPTTPEAIYKTLVSECLQWAALPPPSDVDEGTISWMLAHLAVGVSRGGGRTGRISAVRMRAILADEKKRAGVGRSV